METYDESEFEVENIIDDKVVDGKQLFLLKWKGYTAEYNTWEPEENIYCEWMVTNYRKQKKAGLMRLEYGRGFSMAKIYDCPEHHRLRVINKVDCEKLPTSFTYIDGYVRSANVPLPSTVMFPCSCEPGSPCGMNCECMSVPYYDADGLLCTDYPGPIYECNDMCGCSSDCPNRVVQRGNIIEIDIFRTKAKGWGASTRRQIRKGEYVCRYTGELLSNAEAEERHSHDTTYLFDLDKEVPDGNQPLFTIDARSYGNASHFFNHSCEPNMVIRAVYIDHLDPRLHELAFFAIRDITTGEELTFDYSPSADNVPRCAYDNGVSKFHCFCNTPRCRKFIF